MHKSCSTGNTYQRKHQQNRTNPTQSPQHRSPQSQGESSNHVVLGWTGVRLDTKTETSLKKGAVSKKISPDVLDNHPPQRDLTFQTTPQATSPSFSFSFSPSVDTVFAQDITEDLADTPEHSRRMEGSMEASVMSCLDTDLNDDWLDAFDASWPDELPGLPDTPEHRRLPDTCAVQDTNLLQNDRDTVLRHEYLEFVYQAIPSHIRDLFVKILGNNVEAIERKCYCILITATGFVRNQDLVKQLNLYYRNYRKIHSAKSKLFKLGAIKAEKKYPYINKKDTEDIRRLARACIDEETGNPRFLLVELTTIDDEKMRLILDWLIKKDSIDKKRAKKNTVSTKKLKEVFLYMAHNKVVPRKYLLENFLYNGKKNYPQSLLWVNLKEINQLGAIIGIVPLIKTQNMSFDKKNRSNLLYFLNVRFSKEQLSNLCESVLISRDFLEKEIPGVRYNYFSERQVGGFRVLELPGLSNGSPALPFLEAKHRNTLIETTLSYDTLHKRIDDPNTNNSSVTQASCSQSSPSTVQLSKDAVETRTFTPHSDQPLSVSPHLPTPDDPDTSLRHQYLESVYPEIPENIRKTLVKILGNEVTPVQRKCYCTFVTATGFVSNQYLIKQLNLVMTSITIAKSTLVKLGAIEQVKKYPYINKKDTEAIRRLARKCIEEETGNPRFLLVKLTTIDDEKMRLILDWLIRKNTASIKRQKEFFLYVAHNKVVPRKYLLENFFNKDTKDYAILSLYLALKAITQLGLSIGIVPLIKTQDMSFNKKNRSDLLYLLNVRFSKEQLSSLCESASIQRDFLEKEIPGVQYNYFYERQVGPVKVLEFPDLSNGSPTMPFLKAKHGNTLIETTLSSDTLHKGIDDPNTNNSSVTQASCSQSSPSTVGLPKGAVKTRTFTPHSDQPLPVSTHRLQPDDSETPLRRKYLQFVYPGIPENIRDSLVTILDNKVTPKEKLCYLTLSRSTEEISNEEVNKILQERLKVNVNLNIDSMKKKLRGLGVINRKYPYVSQDRQAIEKLFLECISVMTGNSLFWVLEFPAIDNIKKEQMEIWIQKNRQKELLTKIFLCLASNTIVSKGYLMENFFHEHDNHKYHSVPLKNAIRSINNIIKGQLLIKEKKVRFGKNDSPNKHNHGLLYAFDAKLTPRQLSHLYKAAEIEALSLIYAPRAGTYHYFSKRKEGNLTLLFFSDFKEGPSYWPFFRTFYKNRVIGKPESYYYERHLARNARRRTQDNDNTDNSSVMQDFPSQSSSSTLKFSQDPIGSKISSISRKRSTSREDADDQLQSKIQKTSTEEGLTISEETEIPSTECLPLSKETQGLLQENLLPLQENLLPLQETQGQLEGTQETFDGALIFSTLDTVESEFLEGLDPYWGSRSMSPQQLPLQLTDNFLEYPELSTGTFFPASDTDSAQTYTTFQRSNQMMKACSSSLSAQTNPQQLPQNYRRSHTLQSHEPIDFETTENAMDFLNPNDTVKASLPSEQEEDLPSYFVD